jgi:hypothetical protein
MGRLREHVTHGVIGFEHRVLAAELTPAAAVPKASQSIP